MAELPATLPEAEWTRRTELAELAAALGPDNLRWVGGAVRDTLLGCEVHDIDAATPAFDLGNNGLVSAKFRRKFGLAQLGVIALLDNEVDEADVSG